jgi:hypothetical protein
MTKFDVPSIGSTINVGWTAKIIQNYPQAILGLITELGDFITVLKNLQKTIEDHGTGFDELNPPRIFEPVSFRFARSLPHKQMIRNRYIQNHLNFLYVA